MIEEPKCILIACAECKSQNLEFSNMAIRPWGNSLIFSNATSCPECKDSGASVVILENIAIDYRSIKPNVFYICAFCGGHEFVDIGVWKEKLSTDVELQRVRAKCKKCSRLVGIKGYSGTDIPKLREFWKDDLEKNFG